MDGSPGGRGYRAPYGANNSFGVFAKNLKISHFVDLPNQCNGSISPDGSDEHYQPLLICSTLRRSNICCVKSYRMMWELKTKAFQRKAFLRGAVEYQEVSGAECGAAAGQ